jgi:hypothetical protein
VSTMSLPSQATACAQQVETPVENSKHANASETPKLLASAPTHVI